MDELKRFLVKANEKHGTNNKIIPVEVNGESRLGFMIGYHTVFYDEDSICMCIQDGEGAIREFAYYEI